MASYFMYLEVYVGMYMTKKPMQMTICYGFSRKVVKDVLKHVMKH